MLDDVIEALPYALSPSRTIPERAARILKGAIVGGKVDWDLLLLNSETTLPDDLYVLPPPHFVEHGPSYVTIGWTVPEGLEDGAPLLFKVESRALNSVKWDSDLSTEKQFTKLNLTPGKKYEFRVCIRGEGDKWYPWSPISVQKSSCVVPQRPSQPELLETGLWHLIFCWKPPEDLPGAVFRRFDVQVRGPADSDWVSHYTTESRFKKTTLQPGSIYAIRILCQTTDGIWSSASEDVHFETLVSVPGRVESIWMEQGDAGTSCIRWTKPAEFGRPIIKYMIELSIALPVEGSSTMSTELIECEGLRCAITGLQSAHQKERQTYFVRVKSLNEVGWGEWSDPIDFVTEPAIPGQPQDVRIVHVTPDYCKLAWAPPVEGYRLVQKYVIQYRQAAQSQWRNESSPTAGHTIHLLVPATLYQCRVYCVSHQGNYGGFSDIISFTTQPCRPEKVNPPSIVARKKDSISIQWAPPGDSNSSIQTFHVKWKVLDDDDSDWCETQQSTSSYLELLNMELTRTGLASVTEVGVYNFTAYDLLPACQYAFVVRAENKFGWGAFSERAVAQTLPHAPERPNPPRVLQTSDCNCKISVTPPKSSGRAAEWIKVAWRVRALNSAVPYNSRTTRSAGGFAEREISTSSVKSLLLRRRDTGSVSTADLNDLYDEICVGKAWEEDTWNIKGHGLAIEYTKYSLCAGCTYLVRCQFENDCGWGEWSEAAEGVMKESVPWAPSPWVYGPPSGVVLPDDFVRGDKGAQARVLLWRPFDGGRPISVYQVIVAPMHTELPAIPRKNESQTVDESWGVPSECAWRMISRSPDELKHDATPWDTELFRTTHADNRQGIPDLKTLNYVDVVVISGLRRGSTYQIKMRAVNGVGPSATSPLVQFTIPA